MLASTHSLDGPFSVETDGEGDVDDINVVLFEELIVGAVGARDVVGLCLGLGFGEGASGDGDNGDRWMRAGGVKETLSTQNR